MEFHGWTFCLNSNLYFLQQAFLVSDTQIALFFKKIMDSRKGVDITCGHAEFLLALFF